MRKRGNKTKQSWESSTEQIINKLSLPLMTRWAFIRRAAGDATSENRLHPPSTWNVSSKVKPPPEELCSQLQLHSDSLSPHTARVGPKQASHTHNNSKDHIADAHTSRPPGHGEMRLLTPPKYCLSARALGLFCRFPPQVVSQSVCH